ncbi:hypothetical protein RAA17_05840 [Komagataeibacter rhaeticus]|nr:hypothetical protein [Komagataeibacter rhaeticus]
MSDDRFTPTGLKTGMVFCTIRLMPSSRHDRSGGLRRLIRRVYSILPLQFFNAFNYIPPIIGFSSVGWKDTVRNAQQTGELVWNLVTQPLVGRMNLSSAAFDRQIDELMWYDWRKFRPVVFGRHGLLPVRCSLSAV